MLCGAVYVRPCLTTRRRLSLFRGTIQNASLFDTLQGEGQVCLHCVTVQRSEVGSKFGFCYQSLPDSCLLVTKVGSSSVPLQVGDRWVRAWVIRWRCIQTGPDRYPQGAGIAQCVERRTEKPGAILTRVRVPRFSFSFPESAFSADSLTMCAQPPCAIACINICADVNNPKHWQPYHCLDTRKHAYTGSNG